MPENGTLTLSGQDVTLNQVITASDIGHLVWTPATDTFGNDLAALSFTVTDSGGSTSASSNTITFDVAATPEYEADGDVLVNSYTTGAQDQTSVTVLDDGGWLVTWESNAQDGSNYGIYQQRYSADGTAIGDEIQVNTATASGQSNPAVTALDDGGWVVTWQSSDQDGSGSGIYQQRYDANGNTAGSEVHVSTTTVNAQLYPAVTALDGGGWVVTWQSNAQDGNSYGIYQQRYGANGATVGGEIRVNTTTANDQQVASVTGLHDGGWVVSWTSGNQDGSSYGVYQQRYDANGTAEGGEVRVNTTTALDQQSSTVTALADGGWLVTWMSGEQDGDSYGIYQQRYDADGTAVDGEVLVNTTTANAQQYPVTAALDNGGWAVAWASFTESWDVYMQVYDADGETVGKETLVNSTVAGNQTYPSIAALPDGKFIVSWQDTGVDTSGGIVQTVVSPVLIDKVSLNEDTTHTFAQSEFDFSASNGTLASITVTAVPGSGKLSLDGSDVTVGQVITASELDGLTWTPDANDNGNGLASFKFKAEDSNGDTQLAKLTFNVAPVNDTPTAADKILTLNEDSSITLSALRFGFNDIDGDSLASVVITTLPSTGTLALNGQAVHAGDAINAADLGNLVWTPDANDNGTAIDTLKFKVTDGNGGTSDEHTFTFNVTAVPDEPISADKTVTLDEDGSYAFSASDFAFSDADGDTLDSILITSVPESGTLTLNGVAVSANQAIDAADLSHLVWTPAANANGNASASFDFQVIDSNNLASSATNTITFDVTPVNDAPTGQDNSTFIGEDRGYTFSADDFGFSDIDQGDTLASVTITALPGSGTLMLDGVAVTANQVIDAEDLELLVWTPAANQHGDDIASLSFKVTDSSGATSATANTITFDVTPVPDAPTATDKTITVAEDGSHSFSAADFNFADIDGDNFVSVIIKSVPGEGALTLNGDPVTADQEISVSDLANLKWTPAANENGDGLASFTFTVKDDGSFQSFGRSAAPQNTSDIHTITFNVTPVNDAPTAANNTVTVDEDTSRSFTAADFGFADIDGDTLASVTITVLPENGALTLNGVAVTAGQVVEAADITGLKWMPGADDNGNPLTSFAFKVTDSGGLTSASAYTLTLDVTAVADRPEGTDSTITLSEDGSHSFTAADFGFYDADGDSLASITISAVPASGLLTLNGVAVTASQEISLAQIGGLVWTPAADYNGNGYSLAFTVKDSTGAQSLEANHLVLNVTPTADAPTAVDTTIHVLEDGSHAFAAADFGFADVDGDTLASVTITGLPGSGTLMLNGVAVTENQEIPAGDLGSLVWTPAANENGDDFASLTFTVKDSSGGVSAAVHTITLDVDAVADLPTGADKTVTIDEDSSYGFTETDFGFADGDGDTLASVTIVDLPASGTLTLDGEEVTANQVIAAAAIGGLVWTPDANDNGEGLASLTFKLTDSDGETSADVKTIAFDVDPVNDGPSARADSAKLTEGKSVVVDVLANDKDIDGDALSVSNATVTSGNGHVTINNAGKLVVTYTGDDLDPGEKATITVSYQATDGSESDGGTLKVAVTGVAEAGDDINGTPKNDTLTGTNAGERIFGLAGKDVITAGGGVDNVSAGAGDDKIDGGAGNDKLGAGAGNDIVKGGNGNDEIHGWGGNDTLTGGKGSDTFVFHRRDGDDTITDFLTSSARHDLIDLQDIRDDFTFAQIKSMMHEDGKDVVIDLPYTTEITIKHVDLDDLTKDHFIL